MNTKLSSNKHACIGSQAIYIKLYLLKENDENQSTNSR